MWHNLNKIPTKPVYNKIDAIKLWLGSDISNTEISIRPANSPNRADISQIDFKCINNNQINVTIAANKAGQSLLINLSEQLKTGDFANNDQAFQEAPYDNQVLTISITPEQFKSLLKSINEVIQSTINKFSDNNMDYLVNGISKQFAQESLYYKK